MSHLLIGLDEALELLLEAVVLIIEVSHVLVKGINLGLEVDLVLHHLLGVLLESIYFVSDGLLFLLEFVILDLELRDLELIVLALDILVLVSLKELGLSILVLLILVLVVAKLTIELVEVVLVLLDDLMALSNLHASLDDSLLL